MDLQKNYANLILDVWSSMRRIMNRSDELTPETRGPSGNLLADDLIRYERMLSRGGVFRKKDSSSPSASSKPDRHPSRPVIRQALGKKFIEPKAENAEANGEDSVLSWGQALSIEDSVGAIGTPPQLPHDKIEKNNPILHRLYKDNYMARILRGVDDMHTLDEGASRVHEKFPWMAEATEIVWLAMRRQLEETGIAGSFPALLLVGPAGVGKTTWASSISEAMGLGESIFIDAAAAPSGMTLVGLENGWGSATPGHVVTNMLAERTLNPVVIIDEIDKASALTSNSGAHHSISNSLLGMMGPASKKWTCPFYGVNFPMQHTNWMLTANDMSKLSSWMMSRTTVIEVPYPSLAQMIEMIEATSPNPDITDLVVWEVKKRFAAEQRISPRLVERMINKSLDRKSGPEVCA